MPDKTIQENARTPETTASAMCVVNAAWAMIKNHLSQRRDQIYEEIRAYPPPIPACDEQYNHLLEKRAKIVRELARLDRAIEKGRTALVPAGHVERFMQSSSDMDADIVQNVRGLLNQVR